LHASKKIRKLHGVLRHGKNVQILSEENKRTVEPQPKEKQRINERRKGKKRKIQEHSNKPISFNYLRLGLRNITPCLPVALCKSSQIKMILTT